MHGVAFGVSASGLEPEIAGRCITSKAFAERGAGSLLSKAAENLRGTVLRLPVARNTGSVLYGKSSCSILQHTLVDTDEPVLRLLAPNFQGRIGQASNSRPTVECRSV